MTILAGQLSAGMMVGEARSPRRKVHDIWRHDPFAGSETFGRASRDTVWVVWDDGRGKKGTTTVFDVEERVPVSA